MQQFLHYSGISLLENSVAKPTGRIFFAKFFDVVHKAENLLFEICGFKK